jgi:hypothetical protein
VLGTQSYGHYLAKQGALATDTLTGDDFIDALRHRIEDTFDGTSAELLTLATPDDPDWRPPNPKRWPSNARAVTTHLHRQAPVMRKAGWAIDDDGGNNRAGILRWAIAPPQNGGDGKPAPRNPRNPRQVAEQDILPLQGAGNAGHESVPPLLGGPTDGDIWSLEYPCGSCGGPTAHVTGFCPGCLALQAPEEGNR